ncbi:MAG: hypothetical protein V3W19_08780 [Desulfatiglandales bacterium]
MEIQRWEGVSGMIKPIPKEVESSTSMVSGKDTAEKESPVDEFFRRSKRKPPKFKRVKRGHADPDISEDPDLFPAKLMQSFGTTDMDLTNRLLNQVAYTVPWVKHDANDYNYVVSALHGINPRDELEGLLAVQMVGVHNLAMNFMRLAVAKDQTTDGMNNNVSRVTKLLRTFVAQVEALNNYRGKGQQKVVVEHVHVHKGGQAVVGAVNVNKTGEGGGSDRG